MQCGLGYCIGKSARFVLFALLVAGLIPSYLNAQGATSATILGTATDSSGAVIANAAIEVRNISTGSLQKVTTDGQGRYTVPDLLVGNYEVQAGAPGFQTVIHKGITLAVGSQTRSHPAASSFPRSLSSCRG